MENHIRLHIGQTRNCVLINKKLIYNLRAFHLTTTPELLTSWQYVGNGPKFSEPPDDIFSNEAYPLRFTIGESSSAVNVVLLARPLGGWERIHINLHPDQRDQICFVFKKPVHSDVVDTLVHLGVDIVLSEDPPS